MIYIIASLIFCIDFFPLIVILYLVLEVLCSAFFFFNRPLFFFFVEGFQRFFATCSLS